MQKVTATQKQALVKLLKKSGVKNIVTSLVEIMGEQNQYYRGMQEVNPTSARANMIAATERDAVRLLNFSDEFFAYDNEIDRHGYKETN